MILERQVAIVTGAGQGIGKAITLRFAREGADIGIIDINSQTAKKTGQEIQDLGRGTAVVQADISNYHQVKKAINDIASKLGRIDILVNNAGVEKRG